MKIRKLYDVYVTLLLISIISFCFCFSGCGYTDDSTDAIAFETLFGSESENSTSVEVINSEDIPNLIYKEPEPTVPPFEEYDITLMAVGDNLMHMGVVNTGKQSDGTYDYTCLYDGISEILDKADIKIINQETILGGNHRGFFGYPNFNSPTEVGDSIAKVGFNVVLHASNHSADQGIGGIDSCVSFWESHPEVLMVGIHAPADPSTDTLDIPILEIDDYKFAILNYTYGPNYEVVSKDVVSRMNILCNVDPQGGKLDFTTINPRVLEDIARARELADVVIVCPHWGTEYATTPSSYQQTFAMQMTEAGADLIIGTHPHVVQPVEWITAENGNRSLCFYSLGNYVSTQKTACSMFEALAWVTFHVTENGISIQPDKTGALPLVCHYKSGPVRMDYVYALEDYTEELASKHGIIQYGKIPFHMNELLKFNADILGDSAIDYSMIVTE